MNSVTVQLVDGRAVVTEADEVIYVHEDLWQEVHRGEAAASPGGLELDGDVLSMGVPDQGLGRIQYRYERHDREKRWHILTRI